MSAPVAPEKWHGSTDGYSNHKCRCQPCRDAWADYIRDLRRVRRQRFERGQVTVTHGKRSTYQNWGCRCGECSAAAGIKTRRRAT